jgi:hypothetical protein
MVTWITRTLADGRLTLPDLLFLERLVESRHRDVLRGSASGPAASAGQGPTDPSSEHGGLVLLESGEGCPLRLLPIPSSSVGDDLLYELPTELFTAACLAFWHDHPLDNEEGAVGRPDGPRPPGPFGARGPSLVTALGDRWIACLRGIDSLVFTSMGGAGFSIVFFNSEGEVLGLGQFVAP